MPRYVISVNLFESTFNLIVGWLISCGSVLSNYLLGRIFILRDMTSKVSLKNILTQNLWTILPNSQNEILRCYSVPLVFCWFEWDADPRNEPGSKHQIDRQNYSWPVLDGKRPDPGKVGFQTSPNATSLPRGLMRRVWGPHRAAVRWRWRTPVTNSLSPQALSTDPSVATLRGGWLWNDRKRISPVMKIERGLAMVNGGLVAEDERRCEIPVRPRSHLRPAISPTRTSVLRATLHDLL
jgi:hypothetical protein